ncbi:fused signal recognition particle receptor [Pseudomonas citronellolis]|uniref:signal recognition particle-docking protein FtsY n=1 Tax=Pseudomonas citronellolis TaxID=53408 RepID=UPI00209D5816|nr:signal recognition particle-docking protein FtsY [Pseudomonas citronellolis]MCP1641637.1 fused signal recognition particle receptor [Pseudomonas citronellolis]MCP1664555.1 fused signal recognition particle receptor [Pseudomonas citronellolis]MCP1695529.1 fused signal recognition particle receptor [Pseudomonas citronellolis]MCP1702390.1 fused signal recognition particle receptor [Pseudomonas citronellolis]MCP1796276.1 fused signal recognition particle receptor [Pseudomonas citronellolis]
MFGSNDDKKAPQGGEKKGLFSWFRKKPQAEETVAPASEAEAAPAQAAQAPAAQPEQAAAVPVAEAPRPAPVDELRTPLPVAPAEPLAPAPQAESQPAEPLEPVRPVEPQIPAEPQPPVEAVAPVAPAAPVVEPVPAPAPVAEQPEVAEPAPAAIEKPAVPSEAAKLGFFARLKQGLSKTSASLGEGMASLFLGKKAIDDDLLDEIETRLLTADVGVEATTAIVQNLTRRVARKELSDSEALYKALQEELAGLLRPVEQPLAIAAGKQPYVILVVGVNGVGKTTTIGKLAKKLQMDGKKVMLAAGDTFRAAAVEQLQVWGERNNIAVIAQHTGADSASVIFDAVQAAKARGVDVLIADTAGRLHTKDNLMEELKKVRRVIGKLDDTAPHEVLLVLDAGTGQNAINQAKQFNNAVELTGLALTKLDGTAKGGVIFALAKQFGLPIRYIGVGEGIDDLRTFEADAFVRALFETRETA